MYSFIYIIFNLFSLYTYPRSMNIPEKLIIRAKEDNKILSEKEFIEEFGDYRDIFCHRNKLGSGSYGEVFRCKSKTSNYVFALKYITETYKKD